MQLVAIEAVIGFWDMDVNVIPAWITLFLVVLVLFNLLNVRNLGEIEFWLALTKLQGILVLIVFGLVLVMGASPRTRKLGTAFDNMNVTVVTDCSSTAITPCVDAPGFNCNNLQVSKADL